jgi:hypothetical protein
MARRFRPGYWVKDNGQGEPLFDGDGNPVLTTNWAEALGGDARTINQNRALGQIGTQAQGKPYALQLPQFAGALLTPCGIFTDDLAILTNPMMRVRYTAANAICPRIAVLRENTDDPALAAAIVGFVECEPSREQIERYKKQAQPPIPFDDLRQMAPFAKSDAEIAALIQAEPLLQTKPDDYFL